LKHFLGGPSKAVRSKRRLVSQFGSRARSTAVRPMARQAARRRGVRAALGTASLGAWPLLLGRATWCAVMGWSVPRPQTWSNRLGITLTPIATGVWAAERPFLWNGIDVGGRMAVARMGDGTLLVHSPVGWDEALGAALDALGGGVGHIVSPNFEHLKYAEQWAARYPSAAMYGCPGLAERMPQVSWTQELRGDGAGRVAAWGESMEYLFMDCEANPFTGTPFFNEVVLFHRRSGTLFCSDAFWNYPGTARPNFDGEGGSAGDQSSDEPKIPTGSVHLCSKVPAAEANGVVPDVEVPFGTRLWKWGMDTVYLPFYKLAMVGSSGERRTRYEQCVSKILDTWCPEQVAPCHGDVLRGRELCRRVLRAHFLA